MELKRLNSKFLEQRARISAIEFDILKAIPDNSYTIEIISALHNIQTRLLTDLRTSQIAVFEKGAADTQDE